MKIEVRETKGQNLVQITTLDERWYQRVSDGRYFPSSTWIASHYPKGPAYWKWLASKGWDEAEAIKHAAGIRGSKVHQGIELLTKGQTLAINDALTNSQTGQPEEVTVEEWEALMSFADWWREARPTLIASEQAYYNEEYGYAGTVDMRVEIDGATWLVDLKTSQDIWPEHELQVSSYRHFPECQNDIAAILQVGYRRNKRGWKLTTLEDKFPLFLAARQIWAAENPDAKPKQRDYPRSLKLTTEA